MLESILGGALEGDPIMARPTLRPRPALGFFLVMLLSQAAGDLRQAQARDDCPVNTAVGIANLPRLKDPGPTEIQRIIREFAAKEKLFRRARENYTYHQINKIHEMSTDGEVIGSYEQNWDILYDDRGRRIERVTYAPIPTLKRISVTPEDLYSIRSIQPFVLTTDELPEYEVKYLAHTRVDELTTYVFSVHPRKIRKGKQYFQGGIWVDDQDLQIVKTSGHMVPEHRSKKQENLFPCFVTYREQIDGKFWFPTFTIGDDTLYFSSGPVRVRQIIKYTDYKQFRVKSRITVTGEAGADAKQKP